MLFGKLSKSLILPLLLIAVLMGQVSRDETIQITYPTTGAVIDTNFVDATFNIADFFDLGTPGCANCDGFLTVSLNGSVIDSIYSADALIPLTGLSEGAHTLILEAVDPSGNSYSPAATDTSYFTVNMISVDDLCPVWNFTVYAGDARNYLSWAYPSNEPPAEWYFAHDGTFENAYGSFGGGSGLAQLFMPTGYPATIQSVRFHVSDGGNFTQDVEVNVFADDGTTLLAGPYIVGGDSGWVEVDVDDAVIEAGGFIVSTYNVSTGGPYISVDSDNSSSSLFFGSATDGWNEMGSSYGIFAEGSHEALISAPGARATWVNNSYNNMGDNLPLPGTSIISEDGMTIDPIATSNSGNNNLTNIVYPPVIEMVARYSEIYNTTIYTRHPNDIQNNDSSRDLIPGCGDLTNFSIYLSNGTLVANVDTNSFVHDSLTNGMEYCYYVIANYTGGASTASESICVTPQGFVPAPITNLYGIGLDEEVSLDWTSPDVPQLGVPYSEGFDSELLDLWTLEGDNWFISNTTGNPAPSAYFSYTPTQTNFDLSLTSPVLPYSGQETYLEFDGVDDYVEIPGLLGNLENITLAAWAKLNSTQRGEVITIGDHVTIRLNGTDTGKYKGFFYKTGGGWHHTAINDTNLSSGWHFFTYTNYDSASLRIQKFYIDGNQVARTALDSEINYSGLGSNTRIGMHGFNNTYANFHGSINEVSVWSDGLTHEQIQLVMNNGLNGNEENLVAYWNFNEGSGTTVTDQSGNGNDGTVYGATWVDSNEDVLLTYDFTLDNWSPTGTEHLAVEYRDGATWNTLRDFANSADYAWDTYTDTIPSPSDNLQVRFRAYGDNSFNLDAFIIDNVSITTVSGGGSRDLVDGDFLGYNVYVDSSNSPSNLSLFDSTAYMVENLTNGQSYNFGVTAKYYPDYESDRVSVSVSPTWLFGDLSGAVTDPNGNPLDSAIVSAGGTSDTTDASGYYSIMELTPGMTTVTVRRDGFDNDVDEITVLAQEDAVVHNVMLGPKMDKPRGLEAEAGDRQVMLMWKSPSGLDEVELYYDDGTWESSITGGSTDIELAVKFTPSSAGELYTARFLFSSEGQTGYDLSPVEVRVYSVGFDGLPATSLYVADEFTDVTVEDEWIDVDLSGEGIVFDDQGFYLGFRFTETGGPGIGRDIDGYVYGHSYVFLQGQWLETGDLGFAGNFMMRAVAGLENTTREDIQELVTTANVIHDNMENVAAIIDGNSTGLPAYEISGQQNITFPTQSVRTDSMTGYNVYQVLDGPDTLVATTDPGDTTATISVPANYVEYCYAVSATFQTDSYGSISSKKSNTACAIPYTSGDTDFDSNVSLSDLLSVADYVLEASVPTEDQFRGADVNNDRFINIQDVVLIVDIIYGSSARMLASSTESIAELSMHNGGGTSLLLDLAYDGYVRGIQFDLSADLSEVMFGTPMLHELQEGLLINSHTLEDGTTRVLAVNLNGGLLPFSSDGFITIPVTMNTGRGDRVKVDIDDIQLIDHNGESIPVNAKGDGSVALELIPMQYALYQNFPNPFNPVTEIQFDIPDISAVQLVVYNLMGQEVRRLVNGELQAGYHRVVWDGLNDQGEPVSTGVYIYSLTSPSFHSTKKMVLLK